MNSVAPPDIREDWWPAPDRFLGGLRPEVIAAIAALPFNCPYLTFAARAVYAYLLRRFNATPEELTDYAHIRRKEIVEGIQWHDPGDALDGVSAALAELERHGLIKRRPEKHSGNPEHKSYDPALAPGDFYTDNYIRLNARHPQRWPLDIGNDDTKPVYFCPQCQEFHAMELRRLPRVKKTRKVLLPDEYDTLPYLVCEKSGYAFRANKVRGALVPTDEPPVVFNAGRKKRLRLVKLPPQAFKPDLRCGACNAVMTDASGKPNQGYEPGDDGWRCVRCCKSGRPLYPPEPEPEPPEPEPEPPDDKGVIHEPDEQFPPVSNVVPGVRGAAQGVPPSTQLPRGHPWRTLKPLLPVPQGSIQPEARGCERGRDAGGVVPAPLPDPAGSPPLAPEDEHPERGPPA